MTHHCRDHLPGVGGCLVPNPQKDRNPAQGHPLKLLSENFIRAALEESRVEGLIPIRSRRCGPSRRAAASHVQGVNELEWMRAYMRVGTLGE